MHIFLALGSKYFLSIRHIRVVSFFSILLPCIIIIINIMPPRCQRLMRIYTNNKGDLNPVQPLAKCTSIWPCHRAGGVRWQVISQEKKSQIYKIRYVQSSYSLPPQQPLRRHRYATGCPPTGCTPYGTTATPRFWSASAPSQRPSRKRSEPSPVLGFPVRSVCRCAVLFARPVSVSVRSETRSWSKIDASLF